MPHIRTDIDHATFYLFLVIYKDFQNKSLRISFFPYNT